MRGPTGVCDAERAVARRTIQRILQRLNLAYRSQSGKMMGIIDYGDPSRVVTPILQAPQPLHEDGNDITLSDCSNDSTHTLQAS
jgi:hypothetical protein